MNEETTQPTGEETPETQAGAEQEAPQTEAPKTEKEEKATKGKKKKEKTYTLTQEQMEAAELAAKQLEISLGRRVKMTEGKNGGKIEIDYYDADDREALMDALRSIGNRLPRKNTNTK